LSLTYCTAEYNPARTRTVADVTVIFSGYRKATTGKAIAAYDGAYVFFCRQHS